MTSVVWLLGGGVIYSLGAVAYALKRPDPWPTVFGYHEVFHTLMWRRKFGKRRAPPWGKFPA
jgi:hemolysin III